LQRVAPDDSWLSPSGSRVTLSDNVEVDCLYALDVRGLQGFG